MDEQLRAQVQAKYDAMDPRFEFTIATKNGIVLAQGPPKEFIPSLLEISPEHGMEFRITWTHPSGDDTSRQIRESRFGDVDFAPRESW